LTFGGFVCGVRRSGETLAIAAGGWYIAAVAGGRTMRADTELGRAYRELLELARDLSAAGHHEATYHSLMAALHCAEDVPRQQRAQLRGPASRERVRLE
jgi:hypothetical protein